MNLIYLLFLVVQLFIISGCYLNASIKSLESSNIIDSSGPSNQNPNSNLPILLSVSDDEVYPSLTQSPVISWVSSTSLPEGYHYEIAIGSTPLIQNIMGWQITNNQVQFQSSSLSLIVGQTYYPQIRIVGSNGIVYSEISGDGWISVSLVSVTARYPAASNWNTYVKSSNTSVNCDGTELGYFSCIHGGERKKISYTAASSCTGYEITDELNVFIWNCDDSGGAGNVFFYSKKLKNSAGLADLLNTSSWKYNRVIIKFSSTPVAASNRIAWWNNTIQALPDSPTPGNYVPLTNSIYTVDTQKTVSGGYDLGVSSAGGAIVTLNNSFLKQSYASTNGEILIKSSTLQFFWLEGFFLSENPLAYFFNSADLNHSTIKKLNVSGFLLGLGTNTYTGRSNLFYDAKFTNNTASGVVVKGNYNSYINILSANNGGNGIVVGDISNNNIFQNIVTASNINNGIHVYNSSNNVFISVSSINNGASALEDVNNNGITLTNLFLKNNSTTGLYLNNTTRTTINQIIVDSVMILGGSTNKFTGNFILSNSTASCLVFGGTNPGLITGTCANQGLSNSNYQQVNGFGDNSLLGQVSTDDTSNTSDNNGSALYDTISDWLRFDSFFRAWGLPGSFPGNSIGRCISGSNCKIWDFSLRATDTHLKNTTGNGSTQNENFMKGSPCPNITAGNITTISINSSPVTFLRNAMELLGNGGNNNGLCESGETCLYTPNFGSYQGYGDYDNYSNTCTFSDGTIAGVTMLAHPLN